MTHHQITRIDIFIVLWGVLLTCLSMIFKELSVYLGVLLGAVLAGGNWFMLRHIGQKLIATDDADGNAGARWGLFLALKSMVMLGAVVVVVVFVPVNAIAFVVGLSSLILGVLTHSIQQVFTQGRATVKREL